MDTLPPELLSEIIENIPQERPTYENKMKVIRSQGRSWAAKLAEYASVSRAWKAVIERFTFQSLKITTEDLEAFAEIFSGANVSRRIALTSLTVNVILPTPERKGCCTVTRKLDREADSVAFSKAMVKLFIALKLEVPIVGQAALSLSICEGYRRRPGSSTPLATNASTCKKWKHSKRTQSKALARSGEFELRYEDSIPTVYGVTTLDFHSFYDLEALKPTWVPAIVTRLPDLEKLVINKQDSCEQSLDRRTAQRNTLSASIRSFAGNHLRELTFDVRHHPPANETLPVHKFVDSTRWDQESWFRLFNHAASFPNLAVLHLHGGLVICPQFFRGIIDYTGTPFPALVEFELQFAAETADGGWFYTRDDEGILQPSTDSEPDEDSEDDIESEIDHRDVSSESEDEDGVKKQVTFRALPDPLTFQPFLTDAAKAVARMPQLRKFILTHGLRTGSSAIFLFRVFELWYLRAGTPRSSGYAPTRRNPKVPTDADYVDQNRLYWRVDRWKPFDEAQEAWKDVVGPDAKVVFLEEDKWEVNPGLSGIQVYEGTF